MIRRLPPSLTKEELEEQLQPLPDVDYLEFFSNDTRCVNIEGFDILKNKKQISSLVNKFNLSLLLSSFSLFPHLFARAYINFKNQEDIVLFRDRFDGYVFIDNRGKERQKRKCQTLTLYSIKKKCRDTLRHCPFQCHV